MYGKRETINGVVVLYERNLFGEVQGHSDAGRTGFLPGLEEARAAAREMIEDAFEGAYEEGVYA
jgi:hypothetical protein